MITKTMNYVGVLSLLNTFGENSNRFFFDDGSLTSKHEVDGPACLSVARADARANIRCSRTAIGPVSVLSDYLLIFSLSKASRSVFQGSTTRLSVGV